MTYADPEAQLKYQREWKAARRAAYFADKQCVRCGSTENLQLDHIDPSTKVDHNIWSWSARRRESELAKCQVLCEPCHQMKTNEYRGRHIVEHGTYAMYDSKGCRCDLCKKANAESSRFYRALSGI